MKVRPAALVGFPVIIFTATTLLLVLLYLAAPREKQRAFDPVSMAVENAFVAAVAVDQETGRILAANDQACELLGPKRLTLDSCFSELLTEGSPAECRRLIETAVEQGRAEVQACTVRTHSGRPRVVQLMARSHSAEKSAFVVIGFASNEVSESVAEFARVQERLMSNISHELRTPLNVVMGFSELLTTGTLGELADNQLDAAEECHQGGERMLRLINDILDVGRSRSYYLTGEQRSISPAEMIHRVENLLSGQARREDLRLEVTLDEDIPVIESEERAFKQLVYHLILNSMDRSEPESIVRIRAECVDDVLIFSVSDSGPEYNAEIPPEHAPPAAESEAVEALAPPLLGLPLCATLAERLGADLTTTADADGVHFIVRMPLHGS